MRLPTRPLLALSVLGFAACVAVGRTAGPGCRTEAPAPRHALPGDHADCRPAPPELLELHARRVLRARGEPEPSAPRVAAVLDLTRSRCGPGISPVDVLCRLERDPEPDLPLEAAVSQAIERHQADLARHRARMARTPGFLGDGL